MEGVDVHLARAAERKWLFDCRAMLADRDAHIVRAAQLGIQITEIAELLDMSRQHVSKIARGGA